MKSNPESSSLKRTVQGEAKRTAKVQSQSRLHSKFWASLDYIVKPCKERGRGRREGVNNQYLNLRIDKSSSHRKMKMHTN